MATTKVIDRSFLKNQFKNFNDIIIKPQFSDVKTSLDSKVDKKDGYGLSKNDFTDELKTKLEGLENYDDTALAGRVGTNETNITALQTAVNTLNGDINVTGSVAKTTADAIAAIVASAPADFDTLKEISDWISSHADSAAAMNTAIAANTAAITKLNGDDTTEGSVAYSVKQAIDLLEYEFEDNDIDFTKLDETESVTESISLTGDSTVEVGKTIELTSSVEGVTWSSSDEEKATVADGVVTGVAEGEVTVTAAKDGYTSGTVTVTVTAAPESE